MSKFQDLKKDWPSCPQCDGQRTLKCTSMKEGTYYQCVTCQIDYKIRIQIRQSERD